ncbi:hypothetical protein AOLI_G00144900 [Acnodon oligacanthus]
MPSKRFNSESHGFGQLPQQFSQTPQHHSSSQSLLPDFSVSFSSRSPQKAHWIITPSSLALHCSSAVVFPPPVFRQATPPAL